MADGNWAQQSQPRKIAHVSGARAFRYAVRVVLKHCLQFFGSNLVQRDQRFVISHRKRCCLAYLAG